MSSPASDPGMVRLADGWVDLSTGAVRRGASAEARLTTMEWRLLTWLAERPGEEVSHQALITEVWGYAPSVVSRAPYFTVRRLRSKLEVDPESPTLLQTVHGVGYRYVPVADARPLPRPAAQAGNLPRPRLHLCGRDTLLDSLGAHLHGRHRLQLYGPIGVGKTTLAVTLAHRRGETGWFLSLPAGHGVADVLTRLGALCGQESAPDDLDDLRRRVPRMVAALGPTVIILDDLDPALAEDIFDLLCPPGGLLRVIGVHRARARGPDAYAVPPLSPEDGARLLRQAAERHGRRLGSSEDAVLQALSQRVDGLPLALELLAPRLRVRAPRHMLAQGELPVDSQLEGIVAGALTSISPGSLAVLHAVAAHPGGVDLERLAHLLPEDELVLLDHLDSLTDRALIRVSDPPPPLDAPRFAVFAPVRGHLCALPDHAPVRERARLETVAQAERLVWSVRVGDHLSSIALLQEEANLADACESTQLRLRALLARDHCLAAHAPVDQRAAAAAEAVDLARAGGKPYWIAEALLTRFEVGRGTPGADPADAEAALALSVDARQRVYTWLTLAHHYLVLGQPAPAEVPLAQARSAAQTLGEPLLLHAVLQADLYRAFICGEVEVARPVVAALLAHRRTHRLDRLPRQNLVNWYDLDGQLDAMAEALQADLAIYARTGHRAREARAWMNLGYLQMQRHEPEASASLQKAIQLGCMVGNRQVECLARINVASLLLQSGTLADARVEGLAALQLADALDSDHWRAWSQLTLAQIAACTDAAESVRHLDAAVDVGAEGRNPTAVRFARMLLPIMLYESGDHPRAAAARGPAAEAMGSAPRTERFEKAQRYHRALDLLVQGDPSLATQALAEDGDSGGLRILRAWCRGRLPAGEGLAGGGDA